MLRCHRLWFAGITLLPLFASAQAPSNTVPPRRIGVTLGINSSTLAGEDDGGVGRKIKPIAGAFLVLPATPTLSLQPEILYSGKGAKATELGITSSINLSYLEIPILGRFDIPATGGVTPFVYVGPAIAFKLSCSFSASVGDREVSEGCDDSNGEGPKSLDYSAVVGGGLAFDVGGRAFTIGARYTHGLANIAEDGDAKNRTISVLASFEFPWPK